MNSQAPQYDRIKIGFSFRVFQAWSFDQPPWIQDVTYEYQRKRSTSLALMEMWRIAAQIYCTCRCNGNQMVTRYLAQKQFRDIRDKLDSIRKLSNSIQIELTWNWRCPCYGHRTKCGVILIQLTFTSCIKFKGVGIGSNNRCGWRLSRWSTGDSWSSPNSGFFSTNQVEWGRGA